MRRVRGVRRLVLGLGSLAFVVLLVAMVLWIAVPGLTADSTETDAAGSGNGAAPESAAGVLGGVSEESALGGEAAPRELGGEPFRTCEVCHPDYLEQPGTDGDLVFSHPTHLDQDIDCVTCHEPPLGHFETPAPMMMACLSCHQGETAPNECMNCHRKLDEIAPGVLEPAVHLSPDPKTRETCDKCHDVDTWCEQCHGLIMPHPLGWRRDHGEMALRQSDVCVKCHQSKDKTFCVRCHGLGMPHPSYWFDSHGDIAENSPTTCAYCHTDAPRYCDRCHHAGFNPTVRWAEDQHANVVSERGSNSCLVCHEQAFCDECHDRLGL
jgi:hypothetical protein